MNQELHVVFGAGQIGPHLARKLIASGHRVRIVRRSDKPVGTPGVEVVAGDARDAGFAIRASEGATVIYHCMNPGEYSSRVWEEDVPRLGEALIAAALEHDARLVVLDNLYAYGPLQGRRTEETPLLAAGRKGQVRVRWAERLEQARVEQGLRYVAGRAGDFFGEGADQALVSPDAVRGIRKGKRPIALGDVDAPHAFSYTLDVAAALAALGEAKQDVEGTVFHLPVHEVSPRELFSRIGRELGVERVEPRRIARWVLWVLAPFVALFRELLETYYQWDGPFLVDDSRFRARFSGVGVSLSEAVQKTAALAHSEGGTMARAAHA
ncbi:MAG: NAD-dependent epimerase/dehydratase family protein [Myxococcales bacterium]|nr:NAD-dependent epimerase/dehydratase family protein [Myxococcales bacterium]MCB9581690.1 NAD-dependent epimerase/dehydratase family protein [Polyangiaceae bacterium]